MKALILLLASLSIASAWTVRAPPSIYTYGPKNTTKKEKMVPKPIVHPMMDFSRIDECAFKCLTDAVDSSTPCKVTDLKCACDNAVAIQKPATPCIMDQCSLPKAVKVGMALKKMCREVGVDFNRVMKKTKRKEKLSTKMIKKTDRARKKRIKKLLKEQKVAGKRFRKTKPLKSTPKTE